MSDLLHEALAAKNRECTALHRHIDELQAQRDAALARAAVAEELATIARAIARWDQPNYFDKLINDAKAALRRFDELPK